MNDLIHEASALAEYWRKLYVRTGHVQYLRTAEVLSTLRAVIVDKKIPLPADFNSKPCAGIPIHVPEYAGITGEEQPTESVLREIQQNLSCSGSNLAAIRLAAKNPTKEELRHLKREALVMKMFEVAAVISEVQKENEENEKQSTTSQDR